MEKYQFHSDGSVFFVTFSVVDWLPVFISEPTARIVTDSLNFCQERHGLRINSYVIMPTHFHALVFHNSFQPQPLSAALLEFRKFTGRKCSDYCNANFPTCYGEVFRRAAGDDRKRRFWQASRHPVQIETERFWRTKMDYIHENPCRKGLVRRAVDWRFSSASYWLSEGSIENDVSLTAIEW